MIVSSALRTLSARIVETEAYAGSADPGSHAFRGPTPRTAIMFGPAGYLYVYLSYGVHWCMNVVTGEEGIASAVLLRSAQLLEVREGGVVEARASEAIRGPGNLTRAIGVSGADNGVDCCATKGARVNFHQPEEPLGADEVLRTKRIGLTKGRDRLSRYVLIDW